MSTPEDNIATVERVYEVFANRDYEAALSHFAHDFKWHAADSCRLIMARKNLDFCRAMRERRTELIADLKLDFVGRRSRNPPEKRRAE